MTIQEGKIIEFDGKRFFVDYVEYGGCLSETWFKEVRLKGIKDDKK